MNSKTLMELTSFDQDDYVFVKVEEYHEGNICEDEDDEWVDSENALIKDSEWPEHVDDEDLSVSELSQALSCVTVGSLDTEEAIQEVETSENSNVNDVSTPPFEVIETVSISSLSLADPKYMAIDPTVVGKNTSRLCNKKRRKKMKELRKAATGHSKVTAVLPQAARSNENQSRRGINEESRTARVVSVTNTKRSSPSKIALMCAVDALATYRYSQNLKTKSNYAVLM